METTNRKILYRTRYGGVFNKKGYFLQFTTEKNEPVVLIERLDGTVITGSIGSFKFSNWENDKTDKTEDNKDYHSNGKEIAKTYFDDIQLLHKPHTELNLEPILERAKILDNKCQHIIKPEIAELGIFDPNDVRKNHKITAFVQQNFMDVKPNTMLPNIARLIANHLATGGVIHERDIKIGETAYITPFEDKTLVEKHKLFVDLILDTKMFSFYEKINDYDGIVRPNQVGLCLILSCIRHCDYETYIYLINEHKLDIKILEKNPLSYMFKILRGYAERPDIDFDNNTSIRMRILITIINFTIMIFKEGSCDVKFFVDNELRNNPKISKERYDKIMELLTL